MLDVAEVDVCGADHEGQAHGEEQLQHHQGQHHGDPLEGDVALPQGHDHEQHGHLHEQGDEAGQHCRGGENPAGEVDLCDERGVGGDGPGGACEAGNEELPRQQGDQKEHCVGVEAAWAPTVGLMRRNSEKTAE